MPRCSQVQADVREGLRVGGAGSFAGMILKQGRCLEQLCIQHQLGWCLC